MNDQRLVDRILIPETLAKMVHCAIAICRKPQCGPDSTSANQEFTSITPSTGASLRSFKAKFSLLKFSSTLEPSLGALFKTSAIKSS